MIPAERYTLGTTKGSATTLQRSAYFGRGALVARAYSRRFKSVPLTKLL